MAALAAHKLQPRKTTTEALVGIQRLLGHQFRDPQLVRRALQPARSKAHLGFKPLTAGLDQRQYNALVQDLDGNRKLALVGDACLKLVILDEWYQTGRKRDLAQKLLQNTASNFNLGRVGHALGLDDYVHFNPEHDSPTGNPMATALEALIGALYLDAGIAIVKQTLPRIMLNATNVRTVQEKANKEETSEPKAVGRETPVAAQKVASTSSEKDSPVAEQQVPEGKGATQSSLAPPDFMYHAARPVIPLEDKRDFRQERLATNRKFYAFSPWDYLEAMRPNSSELAAFNTQFYNRPSERGAAAKLAHKDSKAAGSSDQDTSEAKSSHEDTLTPVLANEDTNSSGPSRRIEPSSEPFTQFSKFVKRIFH